MHAIIITLPPPPLQVTSSADGTRFLTGSYNLTFQVFDINANTETIVPLSKTGIDVHATSVRPLARHGSSASSSMMSDVAATSPTTSSGGLTQAAQSALVDTTPGYFDRKVLYFSYSPAEDVVAIAGRNNLFIYNAAPVQNEEKA